MVPRTSSSFMTTLCMVAGWLQMDTITTTPVAFVAATSVSSTLFTLVHSNDTSTPSAGELHHLGHHVHLGGSRM